MATLIQETTSLISAASPVIYQGIEGDCTGCAIANDISLMTNLDGHPFAANPQIIYNMYLNQMGQLGTDPGAVPSIILNDTTSLGLTQNTDISYAAAFAKYGLDTSVAMLPSQADYADASTHTVTSVTTLLLNNPFAPPPDPTLLGYQIAQELNQCKPVILTLFIGSNLIPEMGTQPLSQQTGNDGGDRLGGHMLVVDAINTTTGMLTCASWGAPIGDNGYIQLSLASLTYLIDPILNDQPLTGAYVLNGFNGIDLTQNAATASVAEAYVALLGRAPELSGMQYWQTQVTNGMSLTDLCTNLLNSPETQTILPSTSTNTQFLNYLYSNILNTTPDAPGLAYWNSMLINGVSRGAVAAAIINCAIDSADWTQNGVTNLNYVFTGTNTTLMNESLHFNNAVQTAQDYAIALQAGDQYTTIAHQVLTTVTSDQASILNSIMGVANELGHTALPTQVPFSTPATTPTVDNTSTVLASLVGVQPLVHHALF